MIVHIIMDSKICLYCKVEKPLSSFPKHSHYKDNLDSRCRECVKSQSAARKNLHKKAPPKPALCECCGKVPKKWALDHDHTNNEIRGWLCDHCNTGIGKLGDDIDGVAKALAYLKARTKTK